MMPLAQDLRYSLRTLRKEPGFLLTVLLTLALGIGANTAIFSVVHAVLLRPLPYPNPDRLVMLWQRDSQKGIEQERVTPANFADWRAENRVFEHMAFSPDWWGSRTFTLVGKDGPERMSGALVSSGFFRVLGVQPVLGRTFTPEEDEPSQNFAAVLSYGLWQRRFGGDPGVLGRAVAIDNYGLRHYTVVGVMRPRFHLPDQTEIWLSAGYMGGIRVPPPGTGARCCSWFEVFARLKPGVSLEQARAEMNTIARRITQQHPETRFGPEVKVVPLLDQLVGPVRPALLMLLGAVGFVLLIACANVANLLLARAAGRQREIAIRAALGAGRARIVRQLLTESVLLAMAGGLLGALLTIWSLDLLRATMSDRIPRLEELRPDWALLGFHLLLSLLTGVLFGLAPALTASKLELNEALQHAASQRARVSTSRWLVVSEMALALVLLAGGGLLMRSLLRLQSIDPGFRRDRVVAAFFDMSGSAFAVRDSPQQFFEQLIERVRALPGVQSAAGTIAAPLTSPDFRDQAITLEGQPLRAAADSPHMDSRAITPDYFRTMGIPLLKGRGVTERDDRSVPTVAIVNETMARRYWPGQDPIGQRFAFGSRERLARDRTGAPSWVSVAGLVADVREVGLDTAPRPTAYFSYKQYPWHQAQLVVRASGDPAPVAAAIRTAAKALNPNALITGIRTMDQIIADSIAPRRLRTLLLAMFSAMALLLAAVGIYGVMSYAVARRTREIGIRMALGARPRDVLRLVLGQALKLAALGLAIGVAGAAVSTRLISSQLYSLTATDPVTFAGACLVLLAAALCASYLPARRATRVEPISALRQE